MHRETRADLNETNRQTIFFSLLVNICASVSKELGLKSKASSFAKKDKDVYFIAEMKTTAESVKGRNQLLIYLKRNLELGEDDVSSRP